MHNIRKTNATDLVEAGVPILIIQGQLGHSSGRMLWENYYFIRDTEDEIVDALDGVTPCDSFIGK